MGSQSDSSSQSQTCAETGPNSPSSPVAWRSGGTRRDFNAEVRVVERVYRLADALKAAEKALDAVPSAPRGGRSDLDALLDRPWCLGDFDHLAKQVREIADDWQTEIDREDT